MRLCGRGENIIQQVDDYEGHQQAAQRVRDGTSTASLQDSKSGPRLVCMAEMGQLSEEKEEEEERYAQYERAVYSAKHGGRTVQQAGGDPSRWGPREPAIVEKKMLRAQSQENFRSRIEAQ